MVVYERLDSIERLLEDAKKLPFSSKVMIDADELGLLLKEIKVSLPEELKQAKWINLERKKIITDAHVEADDIITEAQDKLEEHELVELAKKKAADIIEKATADSGEIRNKAEEAAKIIRNAALEYTDGILLEIQSKLDGFIDTINENRRELK